MEANLYIFMQRTGDARVNNNVYPFLLSSLLFKQFQYPETVCVNIGESSALFICLFEP